MLRAKSGRIRVASYKHYFMCWRMQSIAVVILNYQNDAQNRRVFIFHDPFSPIQFTIIH